MSSRYSWELTFSLSVGLVVVFSLYGVGTELQFDMFALSNIFVMYGVCEMVTVSSSLVVIAMPKYSNMLSLFVVIVPNAAVKVVSSVSI